MGMARLPAKSNQSSDSPSKTYLAGHTLADSIAKGKGLKDIAEQLYPGSGKQVRARRRGFIRKVYELAAWDQDFQLAMATRARAILTLALPATSERLALRASRLGKAQDVKLLFEASGFHNPRVQHEHSGDVNIRLVIPRPELPESADQPETIDAEVVEDEDSGNVE